MKDYDDAVTDEEDGTWFSSRTRAFLDLDAGFASEAARIPNTRSDFLRIRDAIRVHCGVDVDGMTENQKALYDWVDGHQTVVLAELLHGVIAHYGRTYQTYLSQWSQFYDSPFALPNPEDEDAVRRSVRVGSIHLHPDEDIVGFMLFFLASPDGPIGAQFRQKALYKIGVPDLACAYDYSLGVP